MRKLIKNKKGVVFNILLVIMVLIVLVYAYVSLNSKMNNMDRAVGQKAMEVLIDVQEGEKALVYLDYSAKLSLYQAIFDLQSQGGIATVNCGKYYGFNMWNDKNDKSCIPNQDSTTKAFKKIYTSNIVARLSKYPKANFIGKIAGLTTSSVVAPSTSTSSTTTPTTTTQTSKLPSGPCFPLLKTSFKTDRDDWGNARSKEGVAGGRCHAGNDLLTQDPGEVVAIEDGTVMNVINSWYTCSSGWGLKKEKLASHAISAVLIYHPKLGKTVNYGEVDSNKVKVKKGDLVKKGQKIGVASYCGMLHLELYEGQITNTLRWYPPEGKSSSGVKNKCAKEYLSFKPKNLLDPNAIISSVQNNFCDVGTISGPIKTSSLGVDHLAMSGGEPQMRAFIRMISVKEGARTACGQISAYQIVVGGTPEDPNHARLGKKGANGCNKNYFIGFDTHPNILVRGGYGKSTAAGRYQFLGSTWSTWNKQYGNNGDFSPASQDKVVYEFLTKRGIKTILISLGTTPDINGAAFKLGWQKIMAPTPGSMNSWRGGSESAKARAQRLTALDGGNFNGFSDAKGLGGIWASFPYGCYSNQGCHGKDSTRFSDTAKLYSDLLKEEIALAAQNSVT